MNNRLDFIKKLNKHCETLTEDDALLFLSHNKKQGDAVFSLVGDWEFLSILFSVKGYANIPEHLKKEFEDVKKMILNTAFNICHTDLEIREKFTKRLETLNQK
jgi:hypothetical protein